MGKAIAIFNQKGGVGKTTTNINLGASLALLGKRILMLDIDPQGNTTSGIGISKKDLPYTVYDLLIEDNFDTRRAILHTDVKNFDIIPASVDLAGAEIELVALEGREGRLRKAIQKVKDDYDYIFIDCPPVEIVADASIINKYSDLTLFIIRAGLLDRNLLADVEKFHTERKYSNMSLILNGTDGGGNRYGYKYGYHYGYAGYTK